jgi:hypothetical protein
MNKNRSLLGGFRTAVEEAEDANRDAAVAGEGVETRVQLRARTGCDGAGIVEAPCVAHRHGGGGHRHDAKGRLRADFVVVEDVLDLDAAILEERDDGVVICGGAGELGQELTPWRGGEAVGRRGGDEGCVGKGRTGGFIAKTAIRERGG